MELLAREHRAPAGGGRPALLTLAVAAVLLLSAVLLANPSWAQNEPPVAVISSPADGSEFTVGEVIAFDGSDSMDEDPDNLTYEWDLDGTPVSGRDKAVVQHSFPTPGDKLVVLRVTDAGGRNSTAFIHVRVLTLNRPPNAVITSPLEGQAFLNGRTISFDGSSSHDPDGGTLVFWWETNITIDPIGTTAKFNLRLPLGRYRVTLHVYDAVGAEGTASVNISVVLNAPPQLSMGRVDPPTGPWDLQDGFDFSVTYRDGDGDPPAIIQVRAGQPGALVAHDMVPTDPTDTDYAGGVRYHALVELPAGEHSYVFTCRDLFFSCATVLLQGPLVYQVQTISFPNLGASVTVNWTRVGTVAATSMLPPAPEPPDTVMMSRTVRTTVSGGTWSQARMQLAYSPQDSVDEETITLLWYDGGRGLWVPALGQHRDTVTMTVDGLLPAGETVMAVFGLLGEEQQNSPPDLVVKYDIKSAYVGEVMWFDASCSTDPDGTVLLFHWDFVDDDEPGPWVPGVRASHVYVEKGTYQVVLRATDDGHEHLMYQNITIRAERDVSPGPWDNPGALWLLATLMVVAFGMAVAYRLHRPGTYEDLFGKAYRERDADEYSQLFRKLTEQELRGDLGADLADAGDGDGQAGSDGETDGPSGPETGEVEEEGPG